MVYYRKYRPQTIHDLDLDSVRERLTAILSAKELPHAFLFTGPKGLGKTSSARILAKAINCENKKGIEPCNKCDNCTSITSGSNLDVLEIDAASNRGIDEIRDLREKIKFSPSSLSKKVYIIDEVHMLTTDAFNALLKTLEEPPSHAVFVLCTTEVEKVPATIASRTFHVQFGKPTETELTRSLERVVRGEKLDVEKDVLSNIFALSEGSFRDASKILEDISIASGDKKITRDILAATYKTAGIDSDVQGLLIALSKKELKGAMQIIDELAKRGADFKIVMEKIAEAIHGMLMLRSGLSGAEFNIESFGASDLKTLLESVNDKYKNLKFAVLPQIPLELVAVGWCVGESIKNEVLSIKESSKSDSVSQPQKVEPANVQIPEKKMEAPGEKKDIPAYDPNAQKIQPVQVSAVHKTEAAAPTIPVKKSDESALFRENGKSESFFAALLSALKEDNHSIAGILRGAHLVEIENGTARFETKYKFHKDKLSEPKTQTLLDLRASEILREPIRVVVELKDK